ncbi:MAG: response regulator [Thermodesulfovibrionales bacterium]|jgi:DNA-binding response OmpR family regulator
MCGLSQTQSGHLLDARPSRHNVGTILLADDDSVVRTITKTILELAGHRVIEAANGEDAVRTFKEHQESIGLVILDIVMPKKNGREAHREILKLEPKIKALFISGFDKEREQVIHEGIPFITKPFQMKVFLELVAALLS